MCERSRVLIQAAALKVIGSDGICGGAENDGHEIAGHEIDGPSCTA